MLTDISSSDEAVNADLPAIIVAGFMSDATDVVNTDSEKLVPIYDESIMLQNETPSSSTSEMKKAVLNSVSCDISVTDVVLQ